MAAIEELMTELLRKAFEALEQMPSSAQDDVARALLGLADESVDTLDAEHESAIAEGRRDVARGAFSVYSPSEALDAAFKRFK